MDKFKAEDFGRHSGSVVDGAPDWLQPALKELFRDADGSTLYKVEASKDAKGSISVSVKTVKAGAYESPPQEAPPATPAEIAWSEAGGPAPEPGDYIDPDRGVWTTWREEPPDRREARVNELHRFDNSPEIAKADAKRNEKAVEQGKKEAKELGHERPVLTSEIDAPMSKANQKEAKAAADAQDPTKRDDETPATSKTAPPQEAVIIPEAPTEQPTRADEEAAAKAAPKVAKKT